MKAKLFVFLLLAIWLSGVQAQPKHANTNMLWANYNTTFVLKNNWTLSNDFQIRSREWLGQWWQLALRTGVQKTINKKWVVSGGLAWFDNVRYFNDQAIFANEWRPWVDLALTVNARKIPVVQRLRFEERFLQKVVSNKKTNDYETRERLRYRLEFTLGKIGKNIEVHAGNEVMVNLNHISDSLFFDQDRIILLANFKTSEASFFQFQFIKNYQLLARNYTLEDQNIFRFSYHQKFSLFRHR